MVASSAHSRASGSTISCSPVNLLHCPACL